MDRVERIAASIIDMVEDIILEEHPWIDVSTMEGNTLLHGIPYYKLEKEISVRIKDIAGGTYWPRRHHHH